jgi:hypothetical protein
MAGFTNAAEAALLDAIFSTLGASGSLWLGLSTTTPAEDGTGVTAPSGNNYSRVAFTTSNFAAASGGAPSTKANSAALSFPEATGSWGTVTHVTVHNHATAGAVQAFGSITSQAVVSGNVVSFDVGDLVFRLGDGTPT